MDLAVDPVQRAALLVAMRLPVCRAGQPVRLVQDARGRKRGLLIFNLIMRPACRFQVLASAKRPCGLGGCGDRDRSADGEHCGNR